MATENCDAVNMDPDIELLSDEEIESSLLSYIMVAWLVSLLANLSWLVCRICGAVFTRVEQKLILLRGLLSHHCHVFS
ncbi:hypothetical protein GOODEAATRI_004298 [Goodea atripinnis]|uniref:Uncharacterized protein n=1 Tax=Goodea atripinnis TaxID=208336 RepID=A0ABV0P397_9TELE